VNCRKCGAKQITRRSAGIFVCRHCGVQPGPFNLDRGGNTTFAPLEPAPTPEGDYVFAERKPRLVASFNIGDANASQAN